MRRVARALALLFVASLALSGALASPQPTPVCGPCGAGLEQAANEPDTTRGLRVTASEATVRVHEDGTATWHVEVRVANETAVDYLREHPDTVDRIVSDAIDYSTVEGPFRNVSATLDGNTIAITYEDANAAKRMPGSVLLVEYLHSRGYETWDVLTADRLTIVGPPGTTVTNDPPGARVSGRNATWHGNASAPLYEAPQVKPDAYVAYAQGGMLAGVWTTVGIALATAPIVFDVFFGILMPPLVLFAVLLGGVAVVGRRAVSRPRLGDLPVVSTAVAGIGALAIVASLPGVEDVLPVAHHRAVAAAGAVYLAMGVVARWRGADVRVRELIAAGCLAVVAVAATLALTLPGEYVSQEQAIREGLHQAVRLLPFVAMPALGATIVGTARRPKLLAGAGVVVAFLAFELTVVWPTQRPFGLVLVFFLGFAVAVAVAGFPLLLLGAVTRGE